MKELREWTNLILTIAATFGVGYLALYAKNQRNEIRLEADARYETIADHSADKLWLQSADGKLADAVNKVAEKQDALDRLVQQSKSETDLKIQHLTDVVNTRQDYADKRKPQQLN